MRSLLLICCASLSLAADAPLASLQDQVRSAIEKAEPGVVAVIVSQNPAYPPLSDDEKRQAGKLGDYRAQPRPSDGIVTPDRDKLDLSDPRNAADNHFGSGVVLTADGRVLTSYHLIAGAVKIYLRYNDGTGSYADIHSADARSDLAVLRPVVTLTNRKPVKIAKVKVHDDDDGTATVNRGQFVIALAHPFGSGFSDGKASASWGLVSNVRRRVSGGTQDEFRKSLLQNYSALIQTDARLNLGSSGGALLNLDGEMIGLLTATAAVAGSEASGGYAIPMDAVFRRIVNVLLEGREIEYGFLGIQPVFRRFDNRVQVASVSPRMAAALGGVEKSDLLLAVDGQPLRELDDLHYLVGGSLSDTTITLTVQRGNETKQLKVMLGKLANDYISIASRKPAAFHGLRVDHVSLLHQQPTVFGEQRMIRDGVLLRDLEPGTPAAEKMQAMLAGPAVVISSVNGTPVKTPAQFYDAVRGLSSARLTVISAVNSKDAGQQVTLP